MAKQQTQDERFTYTTAGGKTLNLSPVQPLQAQMVRDAEYKAAIKKHGEPVKPTYKTEADEVFEHDPTTLTTDEEKAAWLEYKRIEAAIDAQVSEKMLRFFLYHGVDIDPDGDKKWQAEQEYFGLEVPNDPIERKVHYIQSELIFAASDIQGITTKLLEMAGVRPEVVEAAQATFRS
jgi:hypothetical protein